MSLTNQLWWRRALGEQETPPEPTPEGTPAASPSTSPSTSPTASPFEDRPIPNQESRWAAFELRSGSYVTGSSKEQVENAIQAETVQFGEAEDYDPLVLELPEDLGAVRPVHLLTDGNKVLAWSIDKADLLADREENPTNIILYLGRL